MKTKITISRKDVLGRWTGERVASIIAIISHGKFNQITISPVLWSLFVHNRMIEEFKIDLYTSDGGLARGFIREHGTVILVDETFENDSTVIAFDEKSEYTEYDLTDVFS